VVCSRAASASVNRAVSSASFVSAAAPCAAASASRKARSSSKAAMRSRVKRLCGGGALCFLLDLKQTI